MPSFPSLSTMVHNNQKKISKMAPSTSPQRGHSYPEQTYLAAQEGLKKPATLTSLSNELIWEICEYLPKKALVSVCRTSQQLRPFATRVLYSHIVLRTASQFHHLRRVLRKREDLAAHVKLLNIRDKEDEARVEEGQERLSDCSFSILPNIPRMDLRYRWRHRDGLLHSPTSLPFLQSLKTCVLYL